MTEYPYEDIDDLVDEWHNLYKDATDYPPLWEHLGWTKQEYDQWILRGNHLDPTPHHRVFDKLAGIDDD